MGQVEFDDAVFKGGHAEDEGGADVFAVLHPRDDDHLDVVELPGLPGLASGDGEFGNDRHFDLRFGAGDVANGGGFVGSLEVVAVGECLVDERDGGAGIEDEGAEIGSEKKFVLVGEGDGDGHLRPAGGELAGGEESERADQANQTDQSDLMRGTGRLRRHKRNQREELRRCNAGDAWITTQIFELLGTLKFGKSLGKPNRRRNADVMKTTAAVALFGTLWANAAEAPKEVVKEFQTVEERELERPLVGGLHPYFPAPEDGVGKPEEVELNVLRPADKGGGVSPIRSPYLATKNKDGYWRRFALRPEVADESEVSKLKSYESILKVLGEATDNAMGGEVLDGWALDQVGWRLFKPLTPHSVRILHIIVNRKYLRDATPKEIVIERLSVSGGILTEKGRRVLVCDSETSLRTYQRLVKATVTCPKIEAKTALEVFEILQTTARSQGEFYFGMSIQGDAAAGEKITLEAGPRTWLQALEEAARQGDFYVYLRDGGVVQTMRELDTRTSSPPMRDPFAKP